VNDRDGHPENAAERAPAADAENPDRAQAGAAESPMNGRAYVLAVIRHRCADVLSEADAELISMALGGEMVSIAVFEQLLVVVDSLQQRIEALQSAIATGEADAA
jgi:hypothetical protein